LTPARYASKGSSALCHPPPTEAHILNLNKKGVTTGAYLLGFKAGGDPYTHTVRFQVTFLRRVRA